MVKILGIDPSLTGTGLALVERAGPGDFAWTHLSVAKNNLSGHHRLDYIVDTVMSLVSTLQHGDVVVMEGPSFNSGGAKSHELAGGWWLIKHAMWQWMEETGTELAVYIVPPRSRAKYATGNGNAKKDAVLNSVNEWYHDINVTDHNIADAIVLATMGARVEKSYIDDVPPEEFDRMTPLLNMKVG
jgi:Holliday junction resolvasome RuvABC endonuclease subunit